MPAGMSEEEFDEIEELMGAVGSGATSAGTYPTGGRGYGPSWAPTHYRPGRTGVGYPGMPVSPSGVREVLPGVPPEEAMEIGQDLMRRRSKTGDHVDESGNKRRIVTRERFGL